MEVDKELHKRLVEETAKELSDLGIVPSSDEKKEPPVELVTCAHLSKLIKNLSFDSDKLKIVRSFEGRIKDPENADIVIRRFAFDSDKVKAVDIITNPTTNRRRAVYKKARKGGMHPLSNVALAAWILMTIYLIVRNFGI
jgi:hypothetical protein